MKVRNIEKIIGITIDLSHGFGRNGLTQNIIFLMQCINSIPGRKCYLIYLGEFSKNNFLNKDLSVSYENYIKKNKIRFDVIIYGGFSPSKQDHEYDKSKNNSRKYVLLQLGNELTDDIQNSLFSEDRAVNIINNLSIDQIWTSPHYERNITYLKTKYRNNNVIISPYLWSPDFIMKQFEELKSSLKLNEFKNKININKVCVFEPNLYFTKTSLIPINIVEKFEQENPNLIETLSVFNGNKLAKNEYFIGLILYMDIYRKRKDFLKCRSRMPFLKAVKEHGGLVISHQIFNELNYVYFEALYLSLPLIHNSNILSDYGYYYKDCDINKGSDWIKHILKNHKNNIDQYDKDNVDLFKKYSPYSHHNIEAYKLILNEL